VADRGRRGTPSAAPREDDGRIRSDSVEGRDKDRAIGLVGDWAKEEIKTGLLASWVTGPLLPRCDVVGFFSFSFSCSSSFD